MARMFPALRSALETKGFSFSVGSRYSTQPTSYGTPRLADGWDINAVVQDGYERDIWVFKAVEIISGNASRLPFQITVDDEEVERHPLLRVMNKRANPLEVGRAFRKRLSAQVLLSKKGAFVELTHSRAGQIVRADLLPPDRVNIIPSSDGNYVDYFEYVRYDGEVRHLPPEKVRWIREPHPIDPFSGVTPLDSAGTSVELDRLARLYNVNFINRDGRPGGIVGVDTEGLPESELDRISRLFKPGAQHAGNVTAIGVGKGGMNYIDTSAKPRDMAYEATSNIARKEILAAFGVPESIAGDASDRTFDNASEEKFTFWNEIMLPHLELIASAFDGDVDDEALCGFDTSRVEVLEMPARRRREEARKEFDSGLRTAKEYRTLQPELEVIDNPQTRALWMSPAKSPVPGTPEDAAALGMDDMSGDMGGGDMGGAPGIPGGEELAGTATDLVAEAVADGGVIDPDGGGAVDGDAARLVQQAWSERDAAPLEGDAAALVEQARGLEGKALENAFLIADAPDVTFDPGEEELARVERKLMAQVEAIMARQQEAIIDGLTSGALVAGEPIDWDQMMDPDRWDAELQEELAPILAPAAQESASTLLSQVAATAGLLVAGEMLADVAGRPVESAEATAEQIADTAATIAGGAVMLALLLFQSAMREWLAERAQEMQEYAIELGVEASPHDLIANLERMWKSEGSKFAKSVVTNAAQTVLHESRSKAIADHISTASATPTTDDLGHVVSIAPELTRVWCTREDERVRLTHRNAAGQRVGDGEMFVVGGHELPYPAYPLGPASEVRRCRCWLKYQWQSGGTYYLSPV